MKRNAAFSFSLLGQRTAPFTGIVLSCGLGFFYVWVVLHTQIFVFDASSTMLFRIIPYVSMLALFNVVTLFVIFMLYWKKRLVFHGRSYFAFVGLLLLFGYTLGICATYLPSSGVITAIIIILHCMCISVGCSCLGLEWFRVLGTCGSKATIIILVGGSLVAALLFILLGEIPVIQVPFLSLVLPLCSIAVVANRVVPRARLHEYGKEVKLNIPYRLLITVLVSDFACGAILALAGPSYSYFIESMSSVSFTGTAILMLATAFYLKFDFNSLMYKMAFTIMSIGCLLFVLAPAYGSLPGLYVHQIGYRFMLALTYLMSVWLIDKHGLSANWVFPVVTCFAFIGQFFGNAFAQLATAILGDSSGATVVCLIIVVALPTSALFLLDIRNLQNGWGFSRPSDTSAPSADRITLVCSLTSDECSLTKRESEVFAFIAKGYSRKYICEQLVLSPETVKSYANKMYFKIGVHSRQELIELVNRRAESMGGQDASLPQSIL